MRQMIGSSNQTTKAGLVVTTLLLLAVSTSAQTAARQVVVSIPDRKLALMENGEVKKVYLVAVGKASSPSPTGRFQIINRLTDPTYYTKGSVVEPGPENPLGTRWMGLSQKGYGIHGTNVPKSIGKAASHGCIRMAKADLEELFTLVCVGDEVVIVGERNELTAQLFGSAPAPVVMASAQPTAVMGGQ